jgi:peptidoglycan/xylan/chitin deacetylase (PgdA/CDA1 family)
MKVPRILLISILFLTLTHPTNAQTWNGKKCAVVLTYDDGLAVHLTNAIPVLDSVGLKGTFYIADYNHLLNSQIPEWRKAASKGHELANHTMSHPCQGGRAGREFVRPENDMNHYTVKRMTDDILSLNTLLHKIDGKTERTFAYPCGDQTINDTPYLTPVKNKFLAARGVMFNLATSPQQVNLDDVSCYAVVMQSGKELITQVKNAMDKGGLIVFLFHGVGGGHSLNVSLEAHSQLLHFLKQNEKDIWNATMLDVAKYVRKNKK